MKSGWKSYWFFLQGWRQKPARFALYDWARCLRLCAGCCLLAGGDGVGGDFYLSLGLFSDWKINGSRSY